MTHVDQPALGIDVGGTLIKVARVRGGKATECPALGRPTPYGLDGQATAEAVVSAVESISAAAAEHSSAGISSLGVAVPGIVDDRTGVGVWSEHLGWRDFPFRQILETRLHRPVTVLHDVRAGGLAEVHLGAAAGLRNVVFMPIGTGISAALILDGRLYSADGFAGEIGHADVGHGGPCVCGGRGCLEAIASARAIAGRYHARTGSTVTARDVADRAEAGDADARAVWGDAVAALASALAWLSTVLAVDAVVIGGGLSRAGDRLLVPLRAELGRRLTFQRVPDVIPARLGESAGAIGAALAAALAAAPVLR